MHKLKGLYRNTVNGISIVRVFFKHRKFELTQLAQFIKQIDFACGINQYLLEFKN